MVRVQVLIVEVISLSTLRSTYVICTNANDTFRPWLGSLRCMSSVHRRVRESTSQVAEAVWHIYVVGQSSSIATSMCPARSASLQVRGKALLGAIESAHHKVAIPRRSHIFSRPVSQLSRSPSFVVCDRRKLLSTSSGEVARKGGWVGWCVLSSQP